MVRFNFIYPQDDVRGSIKTFFKYTYLLLLSINPDNFNSERN